MRRWGSDIERDKKIWKHTMKEEEGIKSEEENEGTYKKR